MSEVETATAPDDAIPEDEEVEPGEEKPDETEDETETDTPSAAQIGAEVDAEGEPIIPTGFVICGSCGGLGMHPDSFVEDQDVEACERCEGMGWTLTGSKNPEFAQRNCPACGGTGYMTKGTQGGQGQTAYEQYQPPQPQPPPPAQPPAAWEQPPPQQPPPPPQPWEQPR